MRLVVLEQDFFMLFLKVRSLLELGGQKSLPEAPDQLRLVILRLLEQFGMLEMHLLEDIDALTNRDPFRSGHEFHDWPVELGVVRLDPQVYLEVVDAEAGDRLFAAVRDLVLLLLH